MGKTGEKSHLGGLAHIQDSDIASMTRKRLVADLFGVLENAHVVHDPLACDLPRINSEPAVNIEEYHVQRFLVSIRLPVSVAAVAHVKENGCHTFIFSPPVHVAMARKSLIP